MGMSTTCSCICVGARARVTVHLGAEVLGSASRWHHHVPDKAPQQPDGGSAGRRQSAILALGTAGIAAGSRMTGVMPGFWCQARGRPACEMRNASSHRSARSRLAARPNASELCQSASLDRQSVFAISNNRLQLNTVARVEAGSTTKFRVCMHRKAAALRFTTSSVGSSVLADVPAESWLRVNVADGVELSRVESSRVESSRVEKCGC